MTSIVLPQVLVFQEFRAVPDELVDPLRALIVGPEYKLHRYTNETEKLLTGAYNLTLGNEFSWVTDLARTTGGIVEQTYTKVYLEDALLKYWENSSSAYVTGNPYSPPDAITIVPVSGETNKVTITDVNLVDKTGYDLDASFYDRDVKVGDHVILSAIVDGVTTTLAADIIGFEGIDVAAVVGTAAQSSSNKVTQIASGPTAATVTGSVDLTALSGTFDGVSVGVISEVYTITVVRGSTAGNPSTMTLNITTASGKDDVLGYVPTTTAWNQDILLGTLGLEFQFDQTVGTDILVGKWTVTVAQAFTAPTPTKGGTYTGTKDTTYVVKVLRGGASDAADDADKPLVQITTNTGVDASAPTLVDGAVNANTIDIGNYGVTIVWNQVKLCANDKYTIPVTAAGEGAISTIVLNRTLPTELLELEDLTIKLFIKKDVELPDTLFNLALTNWEQSATTITINAGAQDYDSTWRGGAYALPIEGADIYVHWRELVQDHADAVYTVETLGDIADLFTTKIDIDNPLVFGIYKALQNSGTENFPSTAVRAMGVPTNDLAGYTYVLDIAEQRDDVYTLVPLTHDSAILSLFQTHVTSLSSPETALWRILLVSSEEVNPQNIVEADSDASPTLATIDADGYVDLDSGSDVGFITADVKIGDTVRVNYGADAYGEATYEEYVIDQVIAENRVKLLVAPSSTVDPASKIEIWRDLNAAGVVIQMGTKANALTSRRVYNIFPSVAPVDGVDVPGYFLCAAIAGIIGSVAPQQGLTNLEIKGFDNMNLVVNRFSRSQLDELANKGVWIVTHDLKTGDVYTRHQLSTNVLDLTTRELSIVKNVDSISYFFRNRLKRFIGRANVTPSTIAVISTIVQGGINFLLSSNFNALIGGQVLDGTSIRELRAHTILRDRLVIVLDLIVPFPLNNIELHLVI